MNTIRRVTLGNQGLEVGVEGLGCMGMSNFAGGTIYGTTDDTESIATIHRALELGVTMLDTADVYGPLHNERLVGKAIAGKRDQFVVATKFGFEIDDDGNWVMGSFNGRPEYVRKAIERSLRNLGTDYVDLYYLHRVDPTVPIEETVAAMGELVTAGKVRHLGLSEVSGDQLRRAHAIHPISAVQLEWSLWTRDRVRRHVGSASTRHRHRRLLTPRPRTGHRHASCTGEPRTHRPAARVRALVDGERRAQPRDRRPPRRHREGTRPRLGAARPRLGCG